MCDLNIIRQQGEYSRVMEGRIRYYAEKYDPHTILYEPIESDGEEESLKKGYSRRVSLLRELFMNIF